VKSDERDMRIEVLVSCCQDVLFPEVGFAVLGLLDRCGHGSDDPRTLALAEPEQAG